LTVRFQERFEIAAKEASDKDGPLKGVSLSNEDKLKIYSLYKQVQMKISSCFIMVVENAIV
jgi:hypothetical protein